MGNSLPGQITSNLSEQGWVLSRTKQGLKVWLNPRTQEEIEEYSFIVSDNRELSEEEAAYRMRYNSPVLVSGRYFAKHNEAQYCSQLNKGHLYIERIPLRLGEIGRSVSESEVLHIYRQCFIGFDALVRYAGPFDINEDMICLTRDGVVKVWLHSDLSRCLPELRFDGSSASEAGMIRRLVDVVENCAPLDRSVTDKTLKQFLRQNNVGTLVEASNIVELYSKVYQIPISQKIHLAGRTENHLIQAQSNTSAREVETVQLHQLAPASKTVSNFKIVNRETPHNLLTHNPSIVPKRFQPVESMSQRPLSSIVSFVHPKLIHQQHIPSKALNFQPKTLISARSPPQLHHSQSLLNLAIPVPPQMNHSKIVGKHRIESSKQTQSLISMPHHQPTFHKRINEFVKSPELYSKNPHAYKVETKRDNQTPFAFSSEKHHKRHHQPHLQPRLSKNIPMQNQNTHQKDQTTTKVRNFKSIDEAKTTPNFRTQDKLIQNPLPTSQFAHKPLYFNTSAQHTPKQHEVVNSSKNNLSQTIKHRQIPTRDQIVSDFYEEKGRVHTQPPAQAVYFRNKHITKDGLSFRKSGTNPQKHIQVNRIVSQTAQASHSQPVHRKAQSHIEAPPLINHPPSQQLPMAFSSKYMTPGSGSARESLKFTRALNNTLQDNVTSSFNNPFNHPSPTFHTTEHNRSSNDLNTYRTIREESQTVNQSVENTPNYLSNINSQLLQDLQRMRTNALNPKPKPF